MKEVLITGGAGGIGREIVAAMLARGFKVHVIDTDEVAGARLAEQYGHDRVRLYHVDVTDPEALTALAASVSQEMALDHIITLAGRALAEEWQGFAASPMSAIDRSVTLNLAGHLQTIHAFLPLMKKEGDRSVLLVSSINALSDFGLPIYSAAKAGLVGFVNSSVGELGARGIRVNAILPGTVVTEATMTEPKDFEKLLSTTALGRFVPAAEVAKCVAAVTCDLCSMTGQSLVLDAGQSKKHTL